MRNQISALILGFMCLNVQAECQSERVSVQVLGSGGPELSDRRASTSYLIRLDNRGIGLVDTGSGAMLNYEQSRAQPNDLRFILYSHFHVDHSAALPALIKGFYFTGRQTDLMIFGPTGNQWLPSASHFVRRLFSDTGLYPYLKDYLNPDSQAPYHLQVQDVEVKNPHIQRVYQDKTIRLSAVSVHHGPLPALAWKVELAGCRLVFSGDMNNQYHHLAGLAKQADLLVAHHAIPEQATGVARQLHMPPSEIGKIAAKAGVRKLVLSHRMLRTLGREKEALTIIRKKYTGVVLFANDLDQYSPAR